MGRHLCPTLLYRDFSRRRATERFADSRLSWRVPSVVSCLASLPPRGILKRLRVGRKLNAKDRRIRRVSLCSPAYSFGPLCAPFMQPVSLRRFAPTVPALVTKLPLRGASKRMRTRQFSFEYIRTRYTRIRYLIYQRSRHARALLKCTAAKEQGARDVIKPRHSRLPRKIL